MPLLNCNLLAMACLLGWAGLTAPAPGDDTKPRVDGLGDPLPAGALARHGTVRLRHGGEIGLLSFTPDGKSLLSLAADQTLRKWDVATGKEQWRFERKGLALYSSAQGAIAVDRLLRIGAGRGGLVLAKEFNINDGNMVMVSHSADGKVLALVDSRNFALVLDTSSGKVVRKIDLKDPQGHAIAVSPDGKLLAVAEAGGEDHYVRLWDLANDKELPQLALGRQRIVNKLVFSNDGKQLAGISGPHIRLWDVTTGKRTRLYEGHDNIILAIAFSHDGRHLASAGADGSVRVWETASEEEIKKFTMMDTQFTAVAFTPDGKSVVAGGRNIHCWDLATGKEKILETGSEAILALAVSPDSALIASASPMGTIRLWDAVQGEEKRAVKQSERLTGLGLMDGGRTLVLWTATQVRHVDALTGIERLTVKAPSREGLAVQSSPDGSVAAIWHAEEDGLKLWDGQKGTELAKLAGHPGGVIAAVFSPDGKQLMTTGADATLRIWKVATAKETLQIPNVNSSGGAFSPDGKLLAVVTGDDEWSVFEISTGKERCRLRSSNLNGGVVLSFSPDCKLLAMTTGDEVVRLWDIVQGKILRGCIGHQGSILALAFSPRGEVLATGGADGTVRLWRVATGEELRCFEGHQGAVLRLAFSSDAKSLVSCGADQCILVWDANSRAAVKAAGDPVAKNLEQFWADFAHDDGMTAFKAMGAMVALPKEATTFLATKLQPVPQVDPAVIEKLLADLDGKNFASRQKAMRALEKLEGQARPALEKATAKPTSAEALNRLKKLLDRLDGPVLAPEELRVLRAVEVLERIATPQARELLARLAKGAQGARLTREAAASVERLK
jgi:WD40 repeat protein